MPDKTPKRTGQINRRDFVKRAAGMAAIGGGAALLSPGDASAAIQATGDWGAPWRPASPQRLSGATHELARRALTGEHGRGMANAAFALDEDAVAGLSPDMRYAHATMLVAKNAPLRVLPGERVVGAATLLEAPAHRTPLAGVGSVSHTTIGFHRVLETGYAGLRRQIEERLARGAFDRSDPLRTIAGKYGKALPACPSASFSTEAPHRPEYDGPPLTVECRAKLDAKDAFNVLVLNRHKESRHHWEIYSFAGTGCFSAYLPGYAPSEITSKCDITDNKWHDLAMVFSGNRVRLYVDGAQVASERVRPTDATDDVGGALYFGSYAAHGIGCHGAIEEVRISNAARTISGVPEGPLEADAATVGLWRVGETADGDTVLRDASPLANDAVPAVQRRGADLLRAMAMCLDAADVWHARYVAELERLAVASTGAERDNYLRTRDALRNVPENPPETFHEAVQSLWFMYAFQRLMGNWSGIGRIDGMLGPYLERDLAEGRITLDEARETLAHFWIKGCEWIGAFDRRGSGDAQHYQNIILSGVDAAGRDITNPVTYLVLDIVEELHISDFPIAVRIGKNTPAKLLRRIAEVQRHGGGIVAVYNEDVVIDALVKFGYGLEEARGFTNDGCWETLIPGKTNFIYSPFDGLAMLHEVLGLHDTNAPIPDHADFESLYAAFVARLARHIDGHNRGADGFAKSGPPTPLLSMFVDDCIERGRGYYDRGSHYNVLAPHIGGMANVANSLLAIRALVFEDAYLTLPEFVQILRDDWAGQEHLRRLVLKRFAFYGNDNDDADEMVQRVFNDYTNLVAAVPEREGVLRPAGISTFGREIEWSFENSGRRASPDGHRRGEVLATNFSPSPGTDTAGPTAVLKSYCKMDFTRCPNGATVELKVHPDTVRGEQGVDALVGLMRGFVTLAGMFLHIDVVDSALLLDAQRHPEKYPNLSVRIAGWSARFATLDKHWQDMVIGRTQQMV